MGDDLPTRGRSRRRPARERVQSTADELLYREGLTTSIDRIIAESDVSKQTVYGNFGTKDGLVEDYLRRRNDNTLRVLKEAVATVERGPVEQVLSIFRELEKRSKTEDFRGCAFVVAAAESPGPDSAARLWGRRHKEAVRGIFEQVLEPHTPDSLELAEQLMLVYDGAMVTAALRPESHPFTRSLLVVQRLLDVGSLSSGAHPN